MSRWITCCCALALLTATPLPCFAQGGGGGGGAGAAAGGGGGAGGGGAGGGNGGPAIVGTGSWSGVYRQKLERADIVICGTFASPEVTTAGAAITPLHVTQVLRDHPARVGQAVIPIPGRVSVPGPNTVCMVFFSGKDGQLVYLGRETVSAALVDYIVGILNIQTKDRTEQMRFFFNYLEHNDRAVAADAFQELRNHGGDLTWAKQLPAPKIANWLQSPKTPSSRIGFYASLLAECGNPKAHGDLLKSLVDEPKLDRGEYLLRMVAYLKLEPHEAWRYFQKTLQTDKHEDGRRYIAINVLASCWDNPSGGLNKQQILQAMCMLLDDPETAYNAVHFLRRKKAWEMTDRVLALDALKGHDCKVAILEFASESPSPQAKAFVDEQWRRNPELFRALASPPNSLRVDGGIAPRQ